MSRGLQKWLAKKVQTEKVKGCVLFKAKDIYESLNFSLISILRKAGNPPRGLPAFVVSRKPPAKRVVPERLSFLSILRIANTNF